MALVRGDRLTANQRKHVLAIFLHRWTHENARRTYGGRCPACVQQEQCGGEIVVSGKPWHDYHVPLMTDAEWLRNHAFHITVQGQLSRRYSYCEPASLADDGKFHSCGNDNDKGTMKWLGNT